MDAREPAFWFGFEVPWAKLVVLRVVLFGMLALDALLQIRHAPRYGAGGFNVAQLPGLDALGPTRTGYEIAELANAYWFALVALGVATRVVLPIATATYAWLYFGSQLDSYQHHYLVALILLIACFVPWQRPTDAKADTRVRSWALRLLLVQLAILYFWAAVSKMNAAWLDGRTLADQIGGPVRSIVDATIGITWASRFVLVVELVLACTIWIPRAWPIAAPLGLALHVGILESTLEIGLFAWLMIGMYVLVIPDRIWLRAARSALWTIIRDTAQSIASAMLHFGWLGWAVALGLGAGLGVLARFEHAIAMALVLTAVLAGITLVPRLRARTTLMRIGVAHVLALGLWLAVDRSSTVVADYYRFWGGSSRRLGERESAERAYRKLLEIDPADSTGHYYVGTLMLRRGDPAGLDDLHDAQRLEPARARSWVAEARWLADHGQRDAAVEKAQTALRLEPGDRDARDLLDQLSAHP